MAEVILFHHTLGLTPGVVALAERMRASGHTVHTPDLYGGRTFPSIAEGIAFAQGDDAPDTDALADAAVADLAHEVVYAGISSGVMAAQRLAQTRPGATGAILLESCLPIEGDWAIGPWPSGLLAQIHGMADDPFFAGEGDIDAARRIAETEAGVELFVYPGEGHLFEDDSLPWYDEAATALMMQRVLGFLDRVS